MPDDNGKPKATAPSAGATSTRGLASRPGPGTSEKTRYFSRGVADLTLVRIKSARLTEDDLKSLQGNEAKISHVKNILRGAVEEENRLSRHVKDDEGKMIDVDSIRETLASVTEYVSSAKFEHPEAGNQQFHLFVFLLYCGHPVNRRLLLSNAPLQVLGMLEKPSESEARFYNCIKGMCSITLGGRPGTPRYIYLATKETEDVLSAICSDYRATDSILTTVEEMRRTARSEPDMDLPVAVKKQEDPFSFSPKRPSLKVRKEDTAPGLIDTLGIRFEDLRKPRQVDNPRAKELFGGYEIVLTQPGVEGMRLIVTPKHPSDLVDLSAEQIGYIDPSKFKEVITRKGNKVFYILVKKEIGRPTGFSLERLDDSCQILGGDEDMVPGPAKEEPAPKEGAKPAAAQPAEAPAETQGPPSVAQQEPASAQAETAPPAAGPAQPAEESRPVLVIRERLSVEKLLEDEVGRYATIPAETAPQEGPSRPPSIPPSALKPIDEIYAAVREHAKAMGQADGEAPEEAFFGDSIAVLTRSGTRHYLMTDGDWNEAKAAMEEHLSSAGRKAMLTEVMSGFGKKYVRLESGDRATITTRPVGKSTRAVYGEESGHSDTMEMIPREVLERAGALPAPQTDPRDPSTGRRKALTSNLLRSADLYIPASYFLEEESEEMIDSKLRLITEMPEKIDSVRPVEAFGGWYLLVKTAEGKEYALFRFPSPPAGINEDVLSMPAATIFTSKQQEEAGQDFSYVLIETKFLTPGLVELMLRRWMKE